MNDNSQNKYSKWVFTLLEGNGDDLLPSPTVMKSALETVSDKFVFQLEECPTTGRAHYQGCFTTRIRKRHNTILIELGVQFSTDLQFLTVNRMQGSWEQSVEYCTKQESRKGDNPILSKTLQAEEDNRYQGNDLKVFEEKGFFPWQEAVNKIIFKDDGNTIKSSSLREIFWIEDTQGNSGKSLYTKYLCFNNDNITRITFGSGSQMRSALVEMGAKKCYIIDIPRQLCNDDHLNNIYSITEDAKNGYISSIIYGKPRTLFMEPPIIIIFSNMECPTEKLSVDRWHKMCILHNTLLELEDESKM